MPIPVSLLSILLRIFNKRNLKKMQLTKTLMLQTTGDHLFKNLINYLCKLTVDASGYLIRKQQKREKTRHCKPNFVSSGEGGNSQ